MRRSFVYKAKLNATARRNAEWQLARLCELYNAALEERREAWRRERKSISYYSQCKQLREIKQLRPEYALIGSQVLETCLRRLDEAFQAFYRRVRNGERPGYPRFKSARRFSSLTFRAGCGWALSGRVLRMQGIGVAKLYLSRPVEGRVKTVTLKRDACGDWWACFSCDDVAHRPLPRTGNSIGVDVGLMHYAALSDGQLVANPRPLVAAARELRHANRRVGRKRRGGQNRRRCVARLAKHHRRVWRVRADFQWKLAVVLTRAFDLIAVEDLNVRGLARGRLAKSVHDAAWSDFIHRLATKAEDAGRELVLVDPRGTSQVCSECACEVPKGLDVRVHRCPHCGVVLDRDVNAARNILARAMAQAGPVTSRPGSKTAA